jgi:hypothetical protein
MHILRSRTMLFSIALAVLSVLQGYVMQLPLEPVTQMIVGCVVAAAIAVLRAITTQPLSEK